MTRQCFSFFRTCYKYLAEKLASTDFFLPIEMFTQLHRDSSEYNSVAPFTMPSYKSVMSQYSASTSTYESKAPVEFL